LAGHYSDSSNPIPYDTFSLPTNEIPSVNLDSSLSPSAGPSDEVDTAMAKLEAVTKWQQSANDGTGASPSRRSTFTPFNDWTKLQEQILLNVNDERVDLPAPEENLAVRQRMQARMREKNYCAFFHLLDSCGYERIGKPCKYGHGPKLDKEEIVILKNHTRSLPCKVGSNCRNTECFFGHSCQGQPKCFYGSRCHLAKFHNVEPTVIRVWHPSKADRRT